MPAIERVATHVAVRDERILGAGSLDELAGWTGPPMVMMTADRLGRRSVGTIFGWISFSRMAGGALAAVFAGQIHDLAGEYTIAIYVSGRLAPLAGTVAFNVRPRAGCRRSRPTKRPCVAWGY